MTKKIAFTKANRFFFGLGVLAFVIHFFQLSIYLVDIPAMDEWGGASFFPGLQTEKLNWDFTFAPHNSHRIVPTKLQYWLLQHFADLNFATLALINFFLFGLLCYFFLRELDRRFGAPMGPFLVIFASSALHENHFWGFGGQFHFCLGFYFLSVHAALSTTAYRWTSLLWIAASMLSFGTGMAYGGSLVCLFLWLAWSRRNRFAYVAKALLTSAMMGVWYWTAALGDSEFTSPLSGRFWSHFPDLIASGFGYTAIDALPGIAILAIVAALLARLAYMLTRESAKFRDDVSGLLAITVGLIAGLVSTSVGRAHMNSPKTSRYVELGIFLLPILWLMVRHVLRELPAKFEFKHTRLVATAGLVALWLMMLTPFVGTYDYKSVYKPLFHQRQASAACVRRYIFLSGPEVCPIPFPHDISKHVKAAKKAGLLYTQKP